MIGRLWSALNWLALSPILARAPIYGRLLLELLADKRVPVVHKAILGVAAGYLVVPIDIVPDFIPVIGRMDDAVVVVLALDLFLEAIPPSLLNEKLLELGLDGRQLERDLESVRRFVPRPIRALVRRLPGFFDRAATIAREMVEKNFGAAQPARRTTTNTLVPTEEAPA